MFISTTTTYGQVNNNFTAGIAGSLHNTVDMITSPEYLAARAYNVAAHPLATLGRINVNGIDILNGVQGIVDQFRRKEYGSLARGAGYVTGSVAQAYALSKGIEKCGEMLEKKKGGTLPSSPLSINDGDVSTLENVTEPVAAGPSLVQKGEGYKLKEMATKINPMEGYTDVVVHGTPDSFVVQHNGKWEYINQRSLATYLKNTPEYNGGSVRLISCSTGAKSNGIAQQLSNKLGVDVLAPSDTLFVYQNGSMVIGPNAYTNIGKWELFTPGKY